MKRRYERISKICKDLSEEAFKSYAGKRDYKRALEIYSLLATSDCVPSDISNFSKNILQNAGNLFYKDDHARTHSQESHYGLGLSFVKRVMKLHNGTMHLENINHGAQVKLIIPII